jgi:hypothetical protein
MHRVATPLARGERIVVPGEKACDAGQPVAAATDARLRLALLTKKRSDLPRSSVSSQVPMLAN